MMRSGTPKSPGRLRWAISFVSGFIFAVVVMAVPYWLVSRRSTFVGGKSRPIALLFGDSITQHGFNPTIDGWAAHLGHYWSRRVDVVNRGFSGYNSKWGAAIASKVTTLGADIVTIFFGANDAVVSEAPTFVSLIEYEQNLHKIVTSIRQSSPSASIIFMTPPPVWEPDLEHANLAKGKKIARDRSNERTKEYTMACIKIAKELGLPVVDLWTGLGGADPIRQQYLSDGLHLSQKGNQKVFELLKDTLTKDLPQWLPEKLPFDQLQWFELTTDHR